MRDIPCKICGAPSQMIFEVDLNWTASAGNRLPLGPLGIPARHFRCQECGFLFSDCFDGWSDAEIGAKIYNADYGKVDEGYADERPRRMANENYAARKVIVDPAARVLDYGGGIGVFAARFRELGFPNTQSWDPYDGSGTLDGVFDLIMVSEVVEHVVTPAEVFGNLARLLAPDGIILVSTVLVPPDIAALGPNWWYIGPRCGHVSIYSHAALATMAERFGMRMWSDGGAVHILAHADQRPANNPVLRKLAAGLSWVVDIDSSEAMLAAYLRAHRTHPAQAADVPRHIETARRLFACIAPGQQIVDLGQGSPLAGFLARYATVRRYAGDLRAPFDLPDATCDAVFCLDLLQHLETADSAPRSLFAEAWRILRPGGRLLLSTANACSLAAILRLIAFEHPFSDAGSRREYTPAEVHGHALAAGFVAEGSETFIAAPPRPGIDPEALRRMIATLGGNTADRGDMMFFAYRKPG